MQIHFLRIILENFQFCHSTLRPYDIPYGKEMLSKEGNMTHHTGLAPFYPATEKRRLRPSVQKGVLEFFSTSCVENLADSVPIPSSGV